MNLLPTRRDLPYLGVISAVLSTLLLYPMNDDNGHWQSMALELLRYSKWPYIGTWDQNFPGVIIFHVIPIALFGASDIAFRFFDLILQVIFCWMLFRLWSRWLTEREAWLAVMIYAFCYVRSAPFVAGERDMFGAMIVVAIAMPLLKERVVSIRSAILLGLAGGFAVLIRPTFEAYLLLIALLAPIRRQKIAAAVFVIAGLIPLLATFGIYTLFPGALNEYWTATVRFNLDTYAQIARPIGSFFNGLISPKLLTIPALVGCYLLLRKRRTLQAPRSTVLLWWGMLVLTIVFILLQRKYYLYHFALYLILLTPLAGVGIERVLRPLPSRFRMPLFLILFFVASLPYEALIRHRDDIIQNHSLANWAMNSYGDVYGHDPAEPAITQYIQLHTAASDRIEVCSFDPRLRARLDRQPVGKYASLHPLGFRQNIHDPNSLTDYQRKWMHDYEDTIASVRPKYIVMQRMSEAEYLRDPYATVLSRSPQFMAMLNANYRLDTTIGGDDIYARIH